MKIQLVGGETYQVSLPSGNASGYSIMRGTLMAEDDTSLLFRLSLGENKAGDLEESIVLVYKSAVRAIGVSKYQLEGIE